MNNDEKILKMLEEQGKALEALQEGQTRLESKVGGIEKRLDRMQHDQSYMSTAVEALATKRDVETAVSTAKEALRNEIEVLRADAKSDSLGILGKLDKQNSRIVDLEKATPEL